MSGEHVLTIGNPGQLEDAIQGEFLKGRRERRFAMVGRSNVGKSTLINALIGGRLAQTSAEPGKTRLLHFYLWKEGKKIIADLPGYGYAKASHSDRDRWAEFIRAYFDADAGLAGALVLLDARHGPTDLDEEAIRFLTSQNVPVTPVFTKADSLKTQSLRASRRKEAGAALAKLGFDPEAAHWVSAKEGDLGMKKFATMIREA